MSEIGGMLHCLRGMDAPALPSAYSPLVERRRHTTLAVDGGGVGDGEATATVAKADEGGTDEEETGMMMTRQLQMQTCVGCGAR